MSRKKRWNAKSTIKNKPQQDAEDVAVDDVAVDDVMADSGGAEGNSGADDVIVEDASADAIVTKNAAANSVQKSADAEEEIAEEMSMRDSEPNAAEDDTDVGKERQVTTTAKPESPDDDIDTKDVSGLIGRLKKETCKRRYSICGVMLFSVTACVVTVGAVFFKPSKEKTPFSDAVFEGFGMVVPFFEKQSALLIFFIIIGASLAALAFIAWRKLKQSESILEGIEADLHPDVFQEVRQQLLDCVQEKDLTNEQLNKLYAQEIKKLKEGFNALLSRCIANNWPDFVQQRLTAISEALQACAGEPKNSGPAMAAAMTTFPSEQESRSWVRLFASILLFAGIIGTFFGLLSTFQADLVTGLIDALASRETIDALASRETNGKYEELVVQLMGGFGIAFGTSMVAYIMHLCGQYILDQIDEDFDSLISFLDFWLQNQIHIALLPLHGNQKFELDERSRNELNNVANKVLESTITSKKTVEKTQELVFNVSKAASRMEHAVGTLDEATKRLLVGLKESRTEWKDANETWSITSNAFAETSDNLITSVTKSIVSMDDATTAVHEKSKEISDGWLNTTNDILAQMREQSESNATTWNEIVREMLGNLNSSVEECRETLLKYHNQLKPFVKDIDETRRLVHEASVLVNDGCSELQGNIITLVDTEGGLRESVSQSTNKSLAKVETVISQIGTFSSQLAELKASMDALSLSMGANGNDTRLLTLLSDLERTMSWVRNEQDQRHQESEAR